MSAYDQLRPRLFGIAYRMTGSVADADDLCQEAWVRWSRNEGDHVDNPEAYLVSTITRLAIDLGRSAARRREYVGPYLPEPVLGRHDDDPQCHLGCLQLPCAPVHEADDALRDGRAELGANVLNNSWGCPDVEGCDPTSLLVAVRALRAAGVFVVASAGNDGSACSTIADPISLYDEVFSVGAIDEFGEIAPFSSRVPVLADGSGRRKPDVVARGVAVLSA